MINHVTSCAPCRRWQLPRAYFSLASKLGLLVRRIMNRIYW